MKDFRNAAATATVAPVAVAASVVPEKETNWKETIKSRSFDIRLLAVTEDEYRARIDRIRAAKEQLVSDLQGLGAQYDERWDVFVVDSHAFAGKPEKTEETDVEVGDDPVLGKGHLIKKDGTVPAPKSNPLDDIWASIEEEFEDAGEKCPYEVEGSMAALSAYLRKKISEENGCILIDVCSETTGAKYQEAVKKLGNGFNKHYSFFFAEEGQSWDNSVEEFEFGTNYVSMLKALSEYSGTFWINKDRINGLVKSGRLVIPVPKDADLTREEATERFRFMHTSAEIRTILSLSKGESLYDRETNAVDRDYRILCALQGTDNSRNKSEEEKQRDLAMRTEREIQLSNLTSYALYCVAAEAGFSIGERVDYSSYYITTFYEELQRVGSAGAYGFIRGFLQELAGEPVEYNACGKRIDKGLRNNPYSKGCGKEYFTADGQIKRMSLGGNIGMALTNMVVNGEITPADYRGIVEGNLAKHNDIGDRLEWLKEAWNNTQAEKFKAMASARESAKLIVERYETAELSDDLKAAIKKARESATFKDAAVDYMRDLK